jgi:hypothetical protein
VASNGIIADFSTVSALGFNFHRQGKMQFPGSKPIKSRLWKV